MKNNSVPGSLRIWFILHFILDYIVAVPLMIFPEKTLQLFGWGIVDPLASRLVAAALFGIGGVSLIAYKADAAAFRHMLTMKLLWSGTAVIGIGISLAQGSPPFGWVFFMIFAVFFFIWGYYRLRLREHE
ncbi:MAG TPA: hypothetical protein PK253_04725 [Spirochaetota bacterium]|mgnify:CR=1 FL=1|nr:hypothetical protein [Spirochaetota bacterium]HPQ52532.1 hypothetical protein [Spirochaetota bacterium]